MVFRPTIVASSIKGEVNTRHRARACGLVLKRNMPDDVKRSIELMIVAAEHIRDCERCRRVYAAAFDVVRQEYLSGVQVPHPWMALDQCRRELHDCEHWPKGI